MAAEEVKSEGVTPASDLGKLMEEHGEQVRELMTRLADVIPESKSDGHWLKYDETTFLRYVLSYPDMGEAEEAARKMIEFRKTPMIQRIAALAGAADATAQFERSKLINEFRKYATAGFVPHMQQNGGMTVIVRSGVGNPQLLHENMTHEEKLEVFVLFREMVFRDCDRILRETGKLVKQVGLFDMFNVALGDLTDKRQTAVQKQVSEISSYCYPQLQGKMCVLNVPTWIYLAIQLLKKIINKRMMDKVEIFSTPQQLLESPWAAGNLDLDHIPQFLGGRKADSEMPKCLTGELLVKTDGHSEIVVANRTKEEVRVAVPLGNSTVSYQLNVVAYGITFSAVLLHSDGTGLEECGVPNGKETVLRKGEEDKVKADGGICRGEWMCENAGTVLITFDNSYSRFRSKTLRYRFNVTTPDTRGDVDEAATAGAVDLTDVTPTVVGAGGAGATAETAPAAPEGP